ncbi:MAG: hypothetical protein NC416_02935 [Eubacterium sp.]|nr:hypothetical protein [Eubacterium sp.]
MSDFMYELKNVKYIVDNYADKTVDNGFKLIRDGELENLGIDAVIISSFKFKDDIAENLKKNHPGIRYLNLYEKLSEHGIDLQSDYYYHNHPYHHYHTINTIQREIKDLAQTADLEKAYRQLIEHFIHIKDFRTAICHAKRLEKIVNAEENRNLTSDLEELYENQKTAISGISDNNVLMLCIDGLRYQDLSEQYMPKLAQEFDRNAFVFDNAYSFSTSTYESLIPVYSENDDLRTDYYCQDAVSEERCRFIRKAKEQNRRIYFYTDMDTYVDGKEIRYSGMFQTASEKMWNFILDAQEEKNGLFYIHILYESHFSFSNPYTEDELISEGTAMLFDFLPPKGGKLRTDYEKQHKDSLCYLDDILTPMLNLLDCRMLAYADHGNLILKQTCHVMDLQEIKFTCAEEWLRIPYVIRSPEMGTGRNGKLASLMSLNDIVICLMEQKPYIVQDKSFVKIARSELYNPDFRHLYKKIGKEQCLLAFEAFVFEAGYKLLIYANGVTGLFRTGSDETCSDDTVLKELFHKIKDDITVCDLERIKVD